MLNSSGRGAQSHAEYSILAEQHFYQGIRIIGPGELRAAVEMYCEKVSGMILRPLPKNMAARCRTKDK